MSASVSAIPLQSLSSCHSLDSDATTQCSDQDDDPDGLAGLPNQFHKKTQSRSHSHPQSQCQSPKSSSRQLRKAVSESQLKYSSSYYSASHGTIGHYPSSPARKAQMLNILESVLTLVTQAKGLECRRNVTLKVKLDGPHNPPSKIVVDLAIVDRKSPESCPRVYFVVNCESSLDDLAVAMMAASLTLSRPSDSWSESNDDSDDPLTNHSPYLDPPDVLHPSICNNRAYGATIFWKSQKGMSSRLAESNYLFLPFDISVFSMPHATVRAQALESCDLSVFDAMVAQNVDMSIKEFQFPPTYRSRVEFAALLVDTFDQAVAAIIKNL